MLGLSKSAFCRLAESLFPSTDQQHPIHGDFESGEEGVKFVPHSYILRKVKYHAKEVARGDKPYADLKNLTKLYPRVLPDIQSARDYLENVTTDKDGSPSKFHILSHYAIGNSSLNSTARTNLEKLGDDRFTNTKVCFGILCWTLDLTKIKTAVPLSLPEQNPRRDSNLVAQPNNLILS